MPGNDGVHRVYGCFRSGRPPPTGSLSSGRRGTARPPRPVSADDHQCPRPLLAFLAERGPISTLSWAFALNRTYASFNTRVGSDSQKRKNRPTPGAIRYDSRGILTVCPFGAPLILPGGWIPRGRDRP